jgi:predicted lipoprotein
MRTFFKLFTFFLCLGLFNMVACKKQPNFDKEAMLSGIINEYVLPSYQQLLVDNQALETACLNFEQSLTLTSLEQVQAAWKTTMKSWSMVEMLVFGPGRDNYRYLKLDNTPTSISFIENAIADTVLIDSFYIADRSSYTKGLASVEYLIFDANNNQGALLNAYQTAVNKERRFAYLLNCIKNTKGLIKELEIEWSGSYGATLSQSTGNESQEGIAAFSNAIVHMSQTLAVKKLAKPLGKESGDQLLHPEYLESPYAHFSWDIMLYNLKGIQQIFGTSEKGLGSYLNYLINDDALTIGIVAQAKKVEGLIEARQLTLFDDLTTNTAEVELIYEEMGQLYTDLSSHVVTYFSITILANPDDGD